MAIARRHHYIAQFYLRNFADPIFSDDIWVYPRAGGRWEKRTTRGVGWFRDLYTMFNGRGERTDQFETFLTQQVEDPAAPALRKAAQEPEKLTGSEREAIALFIGVTAARTPTIMHVTEHDYFAGLPEAQLADLDRWVKIWCSLTGRQFGANSRSEFTKPSAFSSILIWAASLQERLLRWNWTFVRTTPDRPLVTSDWPLFAEHDEKRDTRFVSFPISSSVAVVVNSAGQIRQDMDPLVQVRAMNRQTLDRAREFVVCRHPCFLGDDFLVEWAQRTPE